MEKKLYIVRCGEVALKGMNRPYFERILLERLKKALSCYEETEAKWIDGLMIVRVDAFVPEDESLRPLGNEPLETDQVYGEVPPLTVT